MDHTEPQHFDDMEGATTKSELYRAAKMAMKLFQLIEDHQDLETWVQTKVAKAADYLDSVYHYLEYQTKFQDGSPVERIEDITGDMQGYMDTLDIDEPEMPPMRHKKMREMPRTRDIGMESARYDKLLDKLLKESDEVEENWRGSGYGSGYRSHVSREMEKELGHETSYNKPKPTLKGMWFYNVPAGQEEEALAVGLKKTKNGKWAKAIYDTSGATAAYQKKEADARFGEGRWWSPNKTESVDTSPSDTVASEPEVTKDAEDELKAIKKLAGR